MERTVTISDTLLRLLFTYAAGCGIDAPSIFASTGLDPLVQGRHAVRVKAEVFDRVWKETADLSSDRAFGLHFAESLQYSTGSHILFVVMMNCPTVGEALSALSRYHSLMNDALRPKVSRAEGDVFLGWESTEGNIQFGRHANEALLCILNSVLARLTEQSCRLLEVRFRHERPADVAEHARIFQAPLKFGQPRSALVIRPEDLERPVSSADPELLATLEGYAQGLLHRMYLPDTWSDKVLRSVSKMMNGRRPTIGFVSRDLAVGIRSLQSRLKEEGTTFSALVDEARKDLALSLMNDPEMPLYDVAFLLGFSEQSSFNHAFRRWSGKTPRAYRRANPGRKKEGRHNADPNFP